MLFRLLSLFSGVQYATATTIPATTSTVHSAPQNVSVKTKNDVFLLPKGTQVLHHPPILRAGSAIVYKKADGIWSEAVVVDNACKLVRRDIMLDGDMVRVFLSKKRYRNPTSAMPGSWFMYGAPPPHDNELEIGQRIMYCFSVDGKKHASTVWGEGVIQAVVQPKVLLFQVLFDSEKNPRDCSLLPWDNSNAPTAPPGSWYCVR
jgi:hypothetical protein